MFSRKYRDEEDEEKAGEKSGSGTPVVVGR
jgi:hypothetical protein